MAEQRAAKVLAGIVTTTDYDALASADLVIEAATENIPLKFPCPRGAGIHGPMK